MAKYSHSSRYENLAKELIHHIFEFKENEANFNASLNYVMSNLLYHHCLDVNSHHVQRSLQGISFKMGIHGHQKKSERLHSLTEKFLASPVLEDKGDLKWSILSLLIELGQHPARDNLSSSLVTEHNTVSDLEIATSHDTDWILELMEKSFHLPDKDDTLSEWSDDDEMLRSFSLGIETGRQKARQKSTSQDIRNIISIQEREAMMSLVKEAHLAKSWLATSVQRPYWNPESERLIINTTNCLHKVPANMLTEYVVMRECIWLLMHPTSGFIFLQNGNTFELRPIEIASLSEGNLRQLLQPVILAASRILFIDQWLKNTQLFIQKDETDHWGTLQSYSDGLRKWRDFFNIKVNILENGLFGKEETPTLLWFLNELEPCLSNLSTIYHVHCKALNLPDDPPLNKSFKLLSLLIQGIDSGLRGTDRACLLVLLKFALRNHLTSLYFLLWGSHPRVDWLLEEFGILKRETRNSGKKKYILDRSGSLDLPGLGFLRGVQRQLLKFHDLKSIINELELSPEFGPNYLVELVVKELDRKFYKNNNHSSNCNLVKPSLPVENTEKNINSERCLKKENQSFSNQKCSCKENNLIVNPTNLEKTKLEMNQLKEAVKSDEIESDSYAMKSSNEDLYLEMAFDNDYLLPIEMIKPSSPFQHCDPEISLGLDHLLSNCLSPLVCKRYDHWGRVLMKSLCEDHNLNQQMKVFVGVVLLSSTCAMDEFYSYLFDKIDHRDHLEENDLTLNLQYSLNFTYPVLMEYFGITLNKEENNLSGLPTNDVFPALSLNIMDLWPLSIILTDSVIAKYNKLFVFCLMLKRAVFILERLHFKEIAGFDHCGSWDESSFSLLFEELELGTNTSSNGHQEAFPLAQRIHRLQLLRHWLLYFANLLHNHFMVAILVPFSQQIESLLLKEHFIDFVNEHELLLNSVCRQCLLNEDKLSPIQRTLSQLFSTVEEVRRMWTSSPDHIVDEKLCSLEDQYSSCHRFMARFFNSLSFLHFCPLVEGLAQSLTHSCPSELNI